jgi:peptidoglycan hydrolase-like protein with peptidoglycan-binding domain
MNLRFRIYHLRYLIFIFLFLIFLFPSFSFADEIGEKRVFNIEKNYDALKREKISAILIKISKNAYFYIDDDWWQQLKSSEKGDVATLVSGLAKEFDNKIYPLLTSLFGSEWKPGIDKDEKITILLHQMKKEAGGYFREADEFEKIISPTSNQREMVYLNLEFLENPIIKANLAHEFTHLIIFNQKNRVLKVEEETFLTEMRTEIVPTILQYPEYLEKRKELFLKNPQDSLTEWEDNVSDYGIASIFAHYLYDYYGLKIFVDSLYSKETSISAIEEALKKNGFQENFSQIFHNFLISVLINDCAFGSNFCFQNQSLKNLKILPEINFLPIGGESSLTIFRTIKDFAGDWQKFIGGYGNLNLEFDGQNNAQFVVSYLICDKSNICQIKDLSLNSNQDGKIFIPDFDKNYFSLTLITFSKTKTSGFDKENPSYNYSVKISFTKKSETPTPSNPILCNQITNNLKFGMRSLEVSCLQEFLKSQGPEIYPEGLVTGYFGPLTLSAVKRFQQKYWQEILTPWGLSKDQATGFVGPTTRAKINILLSQRPPSQRLPAALRSL